MGRCGLKGVGRAHIEPVRLPRVGLTLRHCWQVICTLWLTEKLIKTLLQVGYLRKFNHIGILSNFFFFFFRAWHMACDVNKQRENEVGPRQRRKT